MTEASQLLTTECFIQFLSSPLFTTVCFMSKSHHIFDISL